MATHVRVHGAGHSDEMMEDAAEAIRAEGRVFAPVPR